MADPSSVSLQEARGWKNEERNGTNTGWSCRFSTISGRAFETLVPALPSVNSYRLPHLSTPTRGVYARGLFNFPISFPFRRFRSIFPLERPTAVSGRVNYFLVPVPVLLSLSLSLSLFFSLRPEPRTHPVAQRHPPAITSDALARQFIRWC